MSVLEVLPRVFLQEHPVPVDHDTLAVVLITDQGVRLYTVKGRRALPNRRPSTEDGDCTYQIVHAPGSNLPHIRVDQPLALGRTLIEPRGWSYPCLQIDPKGWDVLSRWVERLNHQTSEMQDHG